jgi:MFS family permease
VTDNDTGKRSWQILAVVLTGSFMAVLDTTIVNVALPSIQQGAHASSGALEWVVSGYALTFGLALVPAGRLGDRYGYKRLFLTGLSLFTLASVACGVSQNAGELIIARLVQGLGAGIYYPAISALIQRLFTGKDRSRAFGYLGGIVGVSTAVGPLLGGVLVQLAGVTDGWRWVFLVNLFIGMAALPVAFRLLPSRHEEEEHRLDFAGNLLLAVVLLLILVPLVEGRVSGWPGWSWLLLGLAVPAAAALISWELRLEHRGGEPVIQVGLLRERRAFGMGQALALVYFAGAAAAGRPGQRPGHRAQPGLRPGLGAARAGGHGGRRADHRAAARRGHRDRGHRHRPVRVGLRGRERLREHGREGGAGAGALGADRDTGQPVLHRPRPRVRLRPAGQAGRPERGTGGRGRTGRGRAAGTAHRAVKGRRAVLTEDN